MDWNIWNILYYSFSSYSFVVKCLPPLLKLVLCWIVNCASKQQREGKPFNGSKFSIKYFFLCTELAAIYNACQSNSQSVYLSVHVKFVSRSLCRHLRRFCQKILLCRYLTTFQFLVGICSTLWSNITLNFTKYELIINNTLMCGTFLLWQLTWGLIKC